MNKPLTLRSWLTLLTSFVTLMVAFSFGLFSLPAFYPSLIRLFHWNRASVTAGGSIVLLLIGLLSPVVGWLVDRFTPKAVLLSGMCVVALSLALLSTAQTLAQYYSFCFLLGVGTSAVSILPTSMLIGHWFSRNRGLAVGFINAGIGLGGVAPSLASAKIAQHGVSGAFLFLSACLAIPFVLTLFVVRSEAEPNRTAGESPVLPASDLVRMPMFWIFGISLFFAAHAMLAIQQNLILYLIGQGLTQKQAAAVLSIALTTGAVVGKLASGVLADRVSARAGMVFSIACVGLGILGLLLTPANSAGIDALALVFGMGYGGIFNATPTIVFEYFGTHRVGKAFGLFYVFFGLGTSSGGVLAGYLFDRTHRYSVPFTLDLGLACAALVLVLASRRQTQRRAIPAAAGLGSPA